jgi:glutamate formiminotransferase
MNVSEGRRPEVLDALRRAGGQAVLDLHADPDHHRAVLTLADEDAARAVAAEAVDRIDLRHHEGVHPRLGAVDVVPFVPRVGDDLEEAGRARDDFARWAGDVLHLPCFLYGPAPRSGGRSGPGAEGHPGRSLPDVRRTAFAGLAPDTGPAAPHPTAGATAVGARPVLVAYNLWLADGDLATAQAIAQTLRGPAVRALGLAVGGTVQVSLNLVAPRQVGPADAYDAVAGRAAVARAELVGLVPTWVLDAVPRHRWAELDLDPSRTVEARLEAAGLA